MSEGFDKEAERRRLREKYEKDQEKRETTQRMSELLLKGATMTNRHCDECGDPIFRYAGQEFCPTCQTQVGSTAAQEAADASAEGAGQMNAAPQAESDGESPSEPAAAPGGDAETGPQEQTETTARSGRTEPARATEPVSATGSADLSTARESLVRTLTRFARQAEESDDPRRARESLAAAREAAEALSALER